MTREWNAYHFVGDTLRDGRPVPADGVTLRHDGPLGLCESGLHASRHVFDALRYAPGGTLCRVYCSGELIKGCDKLVCRERTITARIDAAPVLRRFARKCASDVLHLWYAPDVVREFLRTGRESIREDAWDAASGAAWDGAWAIAPSAAAHAAFSAAQDTTWDAAENAAYSAARSAARSAAMTTKYRRRLTSMVAAEFRRKA